MQFVRKQSKDKGSKFDSASDGRILTMMLKNEDMNTNPGRDDTSNSVTKPTDGSQLKDLKALMMEEFPGIREEDVLEKLFDPENLSDLITGMGNRSLLTKMELENMKQKKMDSGHFAYDFERPVPRGFGPLSSSGQVSEKFDEKSKIQKVPIDDIIAEVNTTSGILGDILLKEFKEDQAHPEISKKIDAPGYKLTAIIRRCWNVYEEYHNLSNTAPYWGMANKNDTIWELQDLCTDGLFNSEFSDRIDPQKILFHEVDLEILGDPEAVNCDVVETSNGEYFQIMIEFKQILRKDTYNRFGRKISPTVEIEPSKSWGVFEIPKTVYNASTNRYRLVEILDGASYGEYFKSRNYQDGDIDIDYKEPAIQKHEISKSVQNARAYEAELINLIDRAQLKSKSGNTPGAMVQESLHNSVNINFPEREDIAWVQKKQAQAADEHHDHRGSTLTTSTPGYQGYAEVKKLFKMWMWRSIGKGTHISGRGKGDKQLYQARMLRGSVGDFYGLYWGQLVGRKRIGVFSKRLTGKISLPKPSSAYIAQPPTHPIGWNTEVLGDWKQSEPFAQFAGRWQRDFGEKNNSRVDLRKDLGDRNYDKYGPHDQIIENKWERMPKHIERRIKTKKENPHGPLHGVNISNFVKLDKKKED